MQRPSCELLGAELAAAARHIARTLAAAGHRAWIVGGAARDLALGRTPADVDMASAARPDQIEALFERTAHVGKAFGTVIVLCEGTQVELTTFRSEWGYSDSRRPDRVRFGSSAEVDSRRRDFTCNALYLDPLTDEFFDPQGGLADLERGVLRCVGEPRERFAEDGLRLLRLARFAGAYDLEPGPGVLEAARQGAGSLAGVSAERVLAELSALFARPGAARGLALLIENDLLERATPRWTELGLEPRGLTHRAVFEQLGSPLAPALALAALFDPGPVSGSPREQALETLLALKPSRALSAAVRALWTGLDGIGELSGAPGEDPQRRARAVRLVRRDDWPDLAHLSTAWSRVLSDPGLDPRPLLDFAAELNPAALFPEPLLSSDDLAASTIPRGRLWAALLHEAEELTLGGALRTRAQALEWLRGVEQRRSAGSG